MMGGGKAHFGQRGKKHLNFKMLVCKFFSRRGEVGSGGVARHSTAASIGNLSAISILAVPQNPLSSPGTSRDGIAELVAEVISSIKFSFMYRPPWTISPIDSFLLVSN